MARGDETSERGRRLRIAVGGLLGAAIVLVVLALAGVFSGDDGEGEEAAERPAAPPAAQQQQQQGRGEEEEPRLSTVRVGGRPTAVAASGGAVWVADSFAAPATVLESEARDPGTARLDLGGPAADVASNPDAAWYALPEQQLVERRDLSDPQGSERIELDGFPTVVAAGEGAVWSLSERAVQRIDTGSGEVGDPIGTGGFASSVAAGEGGVWVVVDNRELALIDPGAGRREAEPVELPEPFTVSVGEGAAWVLSASGELTRVNPASLQPTTAPKPVRGALDVAAGHGSVWVTARNRTVTMLDPETLERVGEPLRVGDEPASIAVGERAVWVANGGDGTLTRIQP